MLKDQCVSVTELRTNTKKCLEGLAKHPKYIFANNKLIGVIVDPDEYEESFVPELIELPEEEVTPELRRLAEEAKKTPKEELLNL